MDTKIIIKQGVATLWERVDLNADDEDASADWQWQERREVPFILELLGIHAEIEDTTFGQFWAWFTADPEITEILGRVYAHDMGYYPIEWYVEQMKKPRDPDDPEDGMTHLEVYWVAEVFRYKAGRKGVLAIDPAKDEDSENFEFYSGFHGYGTWEPGHALPEGEEPCEGGFAIEFTPLNNLAHYPLKLNTKIEPYEWGDGVKGYSILCKDERRWLLRDVIQAILYEITWAGCPGRDGCESQLLLDLKERVKGILGED